MRNKGLSPKIATIIFVSVVIIIALILFLWFNQVEEEGITKFGKNINEVCKEVKVKADFSSGNLKISNTGNIPVFSMKVKYSKGEVDIKELADNWPKNGLNPGASFSEKIYELENEEITLKLILLGESDNGQGTYACSNNIKLS